MAYYGTMLINLSNNINTYHVSITNHFKQYSTDQYIWILMVHTRYSNGYQYRSVLKQYRSKYTNIHKQKTCEYVHRTMHTIAYQLDQYIPYLPNTYHKFNKGQYRQRMGMSKPALVEQFEWGSIKSTIVKASVWPCCLKIHRQPSTPPADLPHWKHYIQLDQW